MNKPKWLEVAMQERGVREVPGLRDNARIEEYFTAVDYPIPSRFIDEIPWCSAFLNWVMLQCGIAGTNSAWSQSWLDWGKPCDEEMGAVAVFSYGQGRGHVGLVYGSDEDGVFVLGGNQKNSVCISYFNRDAIRDYRWPEGL